jgi:multidrug resistance efflux pump
MSDTDTLVHEGRPDPMVAETENRLGGGVLEIESLANRAATAIQRAVTAPPPSQSGARPHRRRVLPLAVTVLVVAVASLFVTRMWNAYMDAPWTRDGTVRAYVVTMAPEVSGRIVELPVADNQFVHKGDLLMVIDPTDYKIAAHLAEATVTQAQANAENVQRQAQRRQQLTTLSVTIEEQQTYTSNAAVAQAQYQQAVARLDQARVNLERTKIRAPVDGWVTNLLARQGDFATAGQNLVSLTDANSFWVDGYFEETGVAPIRVGDPAEVKLMGHSQIVQGHVESIARAINVANAQPNGQGVATVNPIFTWVRLAQRIPVRIQIDKVPDGIVLVAGMTATVQIDARAEHPSN